MTDRAVSLLPRFWADCGLPEAARSDALQRYRQYWDLISACKEAVGLMGRISLEDFWLKHVADSLAVLSVYRDLFGASDRAGDVGCGAGLPGIILTVAVPRLRLVAIESNRRKAEFVSTAADALGLSDRVEVVARRSRDMGHDDRYRGTFALLVARAVAPADKLIRDCRLLLAPGGSAVLYKTPAAVPAELPAVRREAGKHRLSVQVSRVVELPGSAGARQFIRVARP